MKLADIQSNKSVAEKIRNFETEILYLSGIKREEAMNAYHNLLLSTPDQLFYFTRS